MECFKKSTILKKLDIVDFFMSFSRMPPKEVGIIFHLI